MIKIILGVTLGAGIGAAIGYYGKCASGACPLTSNPWLSAIVGAVFGFILATGK